jgi:hypothetical protein
MIIISKRGRAAKIKTLANRLEGKLLKARPPLSMDEQNRVYRIFNEICERLARYHA